MKGMFLGMMKQRLENWLKDEKKTRILLLAGALLAAVLFLGSLFSDDQETGEQTEESSVSENLEAYASSLEQRMETLLAQIEGAGTVQVFLTLENGEETVYQSDTRREESQSDQTGQHSSQDSVVLVEGENGQKQALVQTQKPPAVKGVVVVCSGAENPQVQKQITEAVTAAFSISSTQVAVVKGKN